MMLGSYIWAAFFGRSFTAAKIYAVIDCIVYLLMAFIMDQVNNSQYVVKDNYMFAGDNKE
jgi:hypothetical protein